MSQNLFIGSSMCFTRTSILWNQHSNKVALFSLNIINLKSYCLINMNERDLSTENLKFLSSEQALEDLASFRQFIHKQYKLTDTNKWIAFGGSYPGSLAAWFRLKYPHLVYAAVSSSAPMLAKLNFHEYYQVVNESLANYSSKCSKNIQTAMNRIGDLIRTIDGKTELKRIFKYVYL